MIKLNLGCGIGILSGFINVDACFSIADIEHGIRTHTGPYQNAFIEPGAEFIQADIRDLVPTAFQPDYADFALLNNVIEHFPMAHVIPALTQIFRVLKPGGEILVMTPDFNCLARLWMDRIASKVGRLQESDLHDYHYIAEVIYGNQNGIGEFHSVPMTPDYLRITLAAAGFERIEVTVYPMETPCPVGFEDKGIRFNPRSVNRTDNLIARAYKPVA